MRNKSDRLVFLFFLLRRCLTFARCRPSSLVVDGQVEQLLIHPHWRRAASASRDGADALPSRQRRLFGGFSELVDVDHPRHVSALQSHELRPAASSRLGRLHVVLYLRRSPPPAQLTVGSRFHRCSVYPRLGRLAPSRSRPPRHRRPLRFHPHVS